MTRIRFLDRLFALSDRARKAFQLANQEAHRLNHSAVGLDHLLLGLVKEGLSPAAGLLRRAGLDLAWLRTRVVRLHPSGPSEYVFPGALPYTTELESFVEVALAAGESSRVLPLTPEHLLAALVDEPDEIVSRVLEHRRRALSQLRKRLKRVSLGT